MISIKVSTPTPTEKVPFLVEVRTDREMEFSLYYLRFGPDSNIGTYRTVPDGFGGYVQTVQITPFYTGDQQIQAIEGGLFGEESNIESIIVTDRAGNITGPIQDIIETGGAVTGTVKTGVYTIETGVQDISKTAGTIGDFLPYIVLAVVVLAIFMLWSQRGAISGIVGKAAGA